MDQPLHPKPYRRNLPHLQPRDASLFVTFRLAQSIPLKVQNRWREEKHFHELAQTQISDAAELKASQLAFHRKRFLEIEAHLDQAAFGPTWLKNPEVARIVFASLCHKDQRLYRLDAFTIMSNHVHLLFLPLGDDAGCVYSLPKIMHTIKSYTATTCNKVLKRTGSFWQAESYDHYVRDDEEWIRILHYILRNPVKAGMVNDWREHPFTYCSDYARNFVTI